MARKKKSKKGITPDEKERRGHAREVKSIFSNLGFSRVAGIADREFTYEGIKSDIDDVFIYENIIVLVECTISKSENVSTHLKKKVPLITKIHEDPEKFIGFLSTTFPEINSYKNPLYTDAQCSLRMLYASKNPVDDSTKLYAEQIKYFDYPVLKYFLTLSKTIKKSGRHEFFDFLGLKTTDIGQDRIKPSTGNREYDGSVLPESHSHYQKGYKVVSFYIDPESLIEMAYVLRRDGWNDDVGLYQRMIINSKIRSIRKYLKEQSRVFINNIIVTLPPETKILNEDNKSIDISQIKKTEPATIQIPNGYNRVGIIDGQHRVYSYHEGGEYDEKISLLRKQQNLLATGIIYPAGVSEEEKTRFEANLFLEINSTQSSAKSDLKQAIGLILKPFSTDSIAKRIIIELSNRGELQYKLERHFYEINKIKTTSIVSYGLRPLVKTSGNDSLFFIWDNKNKESMLDSQDRELLNEYIKHCTCKINEFLAAVKYHVGDDRWVTERESADGILTVTVINGLLISLRKIIEGGQITDFSGYKKKLSGIDKFQFKKYKSSQYAHLAEDLYKKCFS